MTLRGNLRARKTRRQAEHDYFAADRTATHMLRAYTHAAETGAPRETLAAILTGIAGCELAMSWLNPAMGWGMEPDDDGRTVGESTHLSGLLVHEIAYAAGDPAYHGPPEYREARAPELQTGEIAVALARLASAYRGDPRGGPVGEALEDLGHAVVTVIGGQATEVLVGLMAAHGHEPRACTCAQCAPSQGTPQDQAVPAGE